MATAVQRHGRGLILGKFMPPHAGHQYLIDFGRHFAEKLTLLVCSLPSQPIPGELRYRWLCELFPDIDIVHITDDIPQEPHEHPNFWDIWRETVLRAVGEPLDYVFASEQYGYRLAAEVGATFIPVDIGRSLVPVSGTVIRQRPLQYWEYLPECVRPYYVKRICIFGPESTGKSTLAKDLAAHFNTVYVSEFARGWLDPKEGVCTAADFPIIARGQLAAEDALARRANRVLFCDTDLLLTTIWSEVFFGTCDIGIRNLAEQRQYDLYLLLDIDVPWVDDVQRYLPLRRQEFFNQCQQVLEQHRRPYQIICGSWQERLCTAIRAVEKVIG